MSLVFNRVSVSSVGIPTKAPEFEYTGQCKVIDEGNGNVMMKFLTSGVLTVDKLNSFKNGIDVLLVGGGQSGKNAGGSVNSGGGAGGTGGYVVTSAAPIKLAKGQYSITVGDGGVSTGWGGGVWGGASSAFGLSAPGGNGSTPSYNGVSYGSECSNGIDPWGIGTRFGAGGGHSGWTQAVQGLWGDGQYHEFSKAAVAGGGDRGPNT